MKVDEEVLLELDEGYEVSIKLKAVGELLRAKDGALVGEWLGAMEVVRVGAKVGAFEGAPDGIDDGEIEGAFVGDFVPQTIVMVNISGVLKK